MNMSARDEAVGSNGGQGGHGFQSRVVADAAPLCRLARAHFHSGTHFTLVEPHLDSRTAAIAVCLSFAGVGKTAEWSRPAWARSPSRCRARVGAL